MLYLHINNKMKIGCSTMVQIYRRPDSGEPDQDSIAKGSEAIQPSDGTDEGRTP
jgi:hypothetical protein